MDRELIENKLESLRRCIHRVEEKRPEDVETLRQDPDLQDILTLNLTRAVQLCVDIAAHLISETDRPPPQTMGKAFETLVELGVIDQALATRMKKAVGFRNVAVHNYEQIDWAILHAIATRNLDDFTQFARSVIQFIELPGTG